MYAGSGRFLGGWTRERGSVERDPSSPRAGSRGICHALLPVALRPSHLPDSSSLYPPFYVRGFPARDAQDSRRKFRAKVLAQILRRIPGANSAQESWRKFCAGFLAQIPRQIPSANSAQDSWRKFCAGFLAQILRRIPGANSAQPRGPKIQKHSRTFKNIQKT